jgi:hypothetical protein
MAFIIFDLICLERATARGRILPRDRHRFAERLFIDHVQRSKRNGATLIVGRLIPRYSRTLIFVSPSVCTRPFTPQESTRESGRQVDPDAARERRSIRAQLNTWTGAE